MKAENFYYPKDYFDFSNGREVTETVINMFIQQAIDAIRAKIKEQPKQHAYFHHISTGNTKVIVECYRQGSATEYAKGNKFTVYVSVATAYKQLSKIDVSLSE